MSERNLVDTITELIAALAGVGPARFRGQAARESGQSPHKIPHALACGSRKPQRANKKSPEEISHERTKSDPLSRRARINVSFFSVMIEFLRLYIVSMLMLAIAVKILRVLMISCEHRS